jgi:hypothetical protein
MHLRSPFIAHLVAIALLVSLVSGLAAAPAAADSGATRQIALAGTGSPLTAASPAGGSMGPEFPAITENQPAAPVFTGVINRSLSEGSRNDGQGAGNDGQSDSPNSATSSPQLVTSFEGLNLFQQRYARSGNQFTVEPPDQGLCVGNGYIVEVVNDVMNVFNASGASVLPNNTSTNIVANHPTDVNHAVDLNSFYGYPPAINRTTGARGPSISDPSCLYDAQTHRFYMVVITYVIDPATGNLVENHIDIAVSTTSNPTGTWKIYKVDVLNDGTHTIPGNACPCLGDYPHIGADANGFYVTTNSYPWNGNGFDGAQLYAFSKRQLASGSATVNVTHLDTFASVNVLTGETPAMKQPGFTVWPAQSPGTESFNLNDDGTEYFLSSNAANEATHPVAGFGGNYISKQLVVWALTNTSSLDRSTPNLTLSNQVIAVNQYALPPQAKQPGSGSAPGTNTPQGHCINDTTTLLFNGQTGCWRLVFGAEPAHNEVISTLDSNDTRMQQVTYANGRIWGALDTAVTIGHGNRAGVAWYVVDPSADRQGDRARDGEGNLSARIARQGTFGMANTDLIYPAIGVTASGQGVIALTLSGNNNYPSAAYASVDAQAGVGDVHVVAAGRATDDGFTSYKSQVGSPPRTRWGDYGSAAVDGNSIWIASEYIAHACDYATWGGQFFGAAKGDNKLGTCAASPGAAGTRAALGNWSTRISKLTPSNDSGAQH